MLNEFKCGDYIQFTPFSENPFTYFRGFVTGQSYGLLVVKMVHEVVRGQIHKISETMNVPPAKAKKVAGMIPAR